MSTLTIVTVTLLMALYVVNAAFSAHVLRYKAPGKDTLGLVLGLLFGPLGLIIALVLALTLRDYPRTFGEYKRLVDTGSIGSTRRAYRRVERASARVR